MDGTKDWEEAMAKYGGRIPSKEQASVLVENKEAVTNSLKTFGSHVGSPVFWTNTEYNSREVWTFCIAGGVMQHNDKNNTYMVCLVAPAPNALASMEMKK